MVAVLFYGDTNFFQYSNTWEMILKWQKLGHDTGERLQSLLAHIMVFTCVSVCNLTEYLYYKGQLSDWTKKTSVKKEICNCLKRLTFVCNLKGNPNNKTRKWIWKREESMFHFWRMWGVFQGEVKIVQSANKWKKCCISGMANVTSVCELL